MITWTKSPTGDVWYARVEGRMHHVPVGMIYLREPGSPEERYAAYAGPNQHWIGNRATLRAAQDVVEAAHAKRGK